MSIAVGQHGLSPADTNQTCDHILATSQEPASDSNRTSKDQKAVVKDAIPFFRLVLYFMAIHFLLAYCELILVAPLIKLFEQSLCVPYYELHDPTVIGPGGKVPELRCKIQAIQAPLATIRGWKSLFDTIPVLVVAIPFGKLADKHGRRKLMAICLLGVATSFAEIFLVCAFPHIFPLRLIWLSSIVLLCGGGLFSAAALMWAMAAEAFSEDRRSQAFYYIFAAFYVAELVGSFTAAVTTDISPWISCTLSMMAILLCFLLLLIMPDLRKSKPVAAFNHEDAVSSSSETRTPLIARPSHQSSSISIINNALLKTNILFTIPVFLTGSLRFTILNILIQYGSNRFYLKISSGAFFYTETAIVNMLLFLFAVPSLSSYFRTKYKISAQTIDLFLLRTCVCFLCLGSLLIGLSPSGKILPVGVLVFAAGFGSRVSTLSLISYWISDDSKATLYATIAVIENIGHAVGDPSLQQIFAATLRLQWSSFWQALPFFVAAGLYCMAGFLTMFIDIRKDAGVLYAPDPIK